MKRMIDNKEFDALKGEVSTLKQEAIEIPKSKDKGIYFALEEPTENSGVYTYANTTIGNINTDIPLKVGDLIMSFDATDLENVKSANMWRIDEVGEDSVEVVLVGKVGGGGGKQLYQHNIFVNQNDNNSKLYIRAKFIIINDSPTLLNTRDLLAEYFSNKFGLEHTEDDVYTIIASGVVGYSNSTLPIRAVGLGTDYLDYKRFGFSFTYGDFYTGWINYNPLPAYPGSITDIVITL